jgi:predicted small secreted protein
MKNFILLALLTLCMTGCNTVRGVGQDVEGGGKAIERAAGSSHSSSGSSHSSSNRYDK